MISVIIPCRNESSRIKACLDSLLAQAEIQEEIEILIADGMSDDGTRNILDEYRTRNSIIQWFDNPDRNTPSALKLLLAQARGDYLIRADAHCEYPQDYIATLIDCLKKTGADNAGGIVDTVPGSDTVVARIIAGCLNSRFGVGISFRTRSGNTPVSVETVPFGAWRADHFQKYGPFDENFTRAQDLEHNLRVVKAGGTVLCLPWLKIKYFARDSFAKLWRMAFQYGYWKIPVMRKHRVRFSIRQFGPILLVIMTALGGLAGPVVPALLIPVGAYFIANASASIAVAYKDGLLLYFPVYMGAFILIHYGYGLGYLRGIIDAVFSQKTGFAEISR